MNWIRTILDGIMMAAYFNFGAAVFWAYCPKSFTNMYPRAIQKIAPKIGWEERKKLLIMYAAVFIPTLAYGVVSAYNAGIEGFWNLFWTAYIEIMITNLGDFFGLDIIFREKFGKRLEVPGTEGHEAYQRKIWLKTLAIPEHFILWPFIAAPICALALAGIGLLIR